MSDSPSVTHRAQKKMHRKMQEGTIISFTTISHPPKGFGNRPRTIGLIELDNGKQILGELLNQKLETSNQKLIIGQRVAPRTRLSRINEQGLRIYEVCYEPLAMKPVETKKEFPGYIVALTGPSGVGKTTISRLLTSKISLYAAEVPILTTREPSNQDENEYTYIDAKKFEVLKKQGKLAAASNIPSSTDTRWYGYRKKDIEAIWKAGKIPVVITEKGLLQDLSRHFGRRSILSFGLLPPGKSKRMMLSCLLHRLRERGRDSEESIRDRLKNAEKDLDFFRQKSHLFDDLIVNEDVDAVFNALKGRVLEAVDS
ncbi:OB-fold domain-containing protein [Patescibacteria group bacterium]|nr:OB-fold domain-containing protein [Patescibacteria group bacterium]